MSVQTDRNRGHMGRQVWSDVMWAGRPQAQQGLVASEAGALRSAIGSLLPCHWDRTVPPGPDMQLGWPQWDLVAMIAMV